MNIWILVNFTYHYLAHAMNSITHEEAIKALWILRERYLSIVATNDDHVRNITDLQYLIENRQIRHQPVFIHMPHMENMKESVWYAFEVVFSNCHTVGHTRDICSCIRFMKALSRFMQVPLSFSGN